MFSKKNKSPKSSPIPRGIRSLLGEGAQFRGSLDFEGSVRIDGTLEGEVTSTGTLYIGEKAVVLADIKVGTVIICGKVSGNIMASHKIIMRTPSEVLGNIRAPLISMQEGVIFQGTCDMEMTEMSFQPIAQLLDSDDSFSQEDSTPHQLLELAD